MSDHEDYDDEYEEIDEDEPMPIKSLFSNKIFYNIKDLFNHEKSQHGFDIVKLAQELNLDMMSYIKLINFIRSNPNADIFKSLDFNLKALPWSSDDFYKTVLEDDPLLQFDIEEDLSSLQESNDQNNNTLIKSYETRLNEANGKIVGLCDLVQELRAFATEKLKDESDVECDDTGYISSYSNYGIHLEMLQDKVRTEGYMNAILSNQDIFRDKIVLDVGCGTGILSLFAAKAGARLVIAVDMSDIIDEAKIIAEENGYADRIVFLKGKIEEVKLPVDQVDIIISEWMGYFLLFESMLDSVISARDRYLSKEGLVLPNFMEMEIFGVSDRKFYDETIAYWSNVYGFRMNTMRKHVIRDAQIIEIKKENMVTELQVFKSLDCCTCTVQDVAKFSSSFSLKTTKDTELTGLGVSFKTHFNHNKLSSKSFFHTDPLHETTHWQQTYFQFDKVFVLKEGENIDGTIEVCKNPNYLRSYLVKLNVFSQSFSYKVQ